MSRYAVAVSFVYDAREVAMLDRAGHFFFKTFSGRLVLLVLVSLGVAYGARVVLVDQPAAAQKERAGAGAATLEAMGDALADRDDASGLPELTQWYPARLPCATAALFGEPRAPIWDELKLPAATEESEFQYRFKLDDPDGAYRVWVRRDSDCDGIYAVWQLQGRVGQTLGREVNGQNILE